MPSPTISLAMVVAAEDYQNCIKAITSCSHVVDEIIIIATGDTTLYLDDSYHHNIAIHHHPWQDNFSLHRNQALSHCTRDWILILDADEEITNPSDIIKAILDTPENINCLLFNLTNLLPGGRHSTIKHPRLFRNHRGFHYRGVVHNEPCIFGAARLANININHYGYDLTPERMLQKAQRRVRLIEAWREREPDNYKPHAYLAHVYGSNEIARHQDAIDSAKRAIQIIKDTKQSVMFLGLPAYPLMQCLVALGDKPHLDELFLFTKTYTVQIPHDPAPYWFMLLASKAYGDWPKVRQYAILFLALHAFAVDKPELFINFENMTTSHQDYIINTILPECAQHLKGSDA